jgi:hypothetical protein
MSFIEGIFEGFAISDLLVGYGAILCILIALLYLLIGANYFLRKVTTNVSPVTASGFIQILESQIRSIKIQQTRRKEDTLTEIPQAVRYYMKKLSAMEISLLFGDIAQIPHPRGFDDVRRAVTIASALYGFPIPPILICFDSRTAQIYKFIKAEQELVIAKKEFMLEADISESILGFENYRKAYPTVSKTLAHFALEGRYPSFHVFWTTFKKNYKNSSLKINSPEVLRSIVTAYAASVALPVPREYIAMDRLAFSIVKAVEAANKAPPKLIVV